VLLPQFVQFVFFSRLSDVKKHLVEWRNRAVSRSELSSLSDQQLWDIGITRGTAKFEAGKPFWRR
jgi:uncharacterized protein YjiS (DUF1127 family)